MTQIMGLDIAWKQPSVTAIKATGAQFVIRYLSNDPAKNLTIAHIGAYRAAGIGIGVVWETTANRAGAGHGAGVADAKAADAERAALGLPVDMVIYFAVDYDTDYPSVKPYFDGLRSILMAGCVGIYAGIRVTEASAADGIVYRWQTAAWSAGRIGAHTTIYQDGTQLLGGAADRNIAYRADYGQYPRPTTQEDPLSVIFSQASSASTRPGSNVETGEVSILTPGIRAHIIEGATWAKFLNAGAKAVILTGDEIDSLAPVKVTPGAPGPQIDAGALAAAITAQLPTHDADAIAAAVRHVLGVALS